MRAFMFTPAHRSVMPKLLQWCDEAAVIHWLQETRQSRRHGTRPIAVCNRRGEPRRSIILQRRKSVFKSRRRKHCGNCDVSGL
jgi:hypothetical protein